MLHQLWRHLPTSPGDSDAQMLLKLVPPFWFILFPIQNPCFICFFIFVLYPFFGPQNHVKTTPPKKNKTNPAWPRRAVKTLSNVASRSPSQVVIVAWVRDGKGNSHAQKSYKTENLTKIGRCQWSPELVKVLQHLRGNIRESICLQIFERFEASITKYLLDSWAW